MESPHAYDEIAAALAAGRCLAYSGDISDLGAIRLRLPATSYDISSELISKEPLAPLVRDFPGLRIVLEVLHYAGKPEASKVLASAIAIVDVTGADHTPRELTLPLAGYPYWHPTSDVIVFRTNRVDPDSGALLDPEAASDLYTIRADGSGLTKVTGGSSASSPPSLTMDWTPLRWPCVKLSTMASPVTMSF